MKIKVSHPSGHTAERRYILEHLLSHCLGCTVVYERPGGTEVRLCPEGSDDELVLLDGLFGFPETDWLTKHCLPQTPVRRLAVDPPLDDHLIKPWLPQLFGARDRSLITKEGGDIWLAYDLFGTAFFLLTRYEEVVLDVRDDHGRFPAQASTAFRNDFLDRPLVDELAQLLGALLGQLAPPGPPSKPVPSLRLTTDLDRLTATRGRSVRKTLGDVRGDLERRHRPGLALARLWSMLRTRNATSPDLWQTHEYLMKVAEKQGLQHTFYLIASQEDSLDADYALDDPHVVDMVRMIHQRGHVLGIHGSYRSQGDPVRLSQEVQALGRLCKKVGGSAPTEGRQHYLRWTNPASARAAVAAGIEADSTIGFAEACGYRAGTAVPFPVFDLLARRTLPLTEIPLIVMDQSILGYGGGSWKDLERTIRQYAARTWKTGGTYTILIHNNTLDTPQRRRRYARLVDGLAKDLQAFQDKTEIDASPPEPQLR